MQDELIDIYSSDKLSHNPYVRKAFFFCFFRIRMLSVTIIVDYIGSTYDQVKYLLRRQ